MACKICVPEVSLVPKKWGHSITPHFGYKEQKWCGFILVTEVTRIFTPLPFFVLFLFFHKKCSSLNACVSYFAAFSKFLVCIVTTLPLRLPSFIHKFKTYRSRSRSREREPRLSLAELRAATQDPPLSQPPPVGISLSEAQARMASSAAAMAVDGGYAPGYGTLPGPYKAGFINRYSKFQNLMTKFAGRRGFTPVFLRRGSRASKAFFGRTRRRARGIQRYNRRQYGYRGRGQYLSGESYNPAWQEYGFTEQMFNDLPETSSENLGGLTLPSVTGAPHMGPFNEVREFPLSRRDAKYWYHDKKYGEFGPSSYFLPNEADRDLLRSSSTHWSDWVAKGIFGLKDVIGDPYGIGWISSNEQKFADVNANGSSFNPSSNAVPGVSSEERWNPAPSDPYKLPAQYEFSPLQQEVWYHNQELLGRSRESIIKQIKGIYGNHITLDNNGTIVLDNVTHTENPPVVPFKPNILKSYSIQRAFGNVGTTVSGRGAYAVQSNDLAPGASTIPEPPKFTAQDDGPLLLSNREFICKIYAPSKPGEFINLVFDINPGLVATFPWLSQVACNFDEYELIQLCFTYKPVVAEYASTTGAVGQVAMAVQYDVCDDPFDNIQTALRSYKATSSKTSEMQLQWVECDPKLNSGSAGKYTRTGPTCKDLKDYDLGKLNLMVTDCPSTYVDQAMGELWVSYKVLVRKPKEVSAVGWAIDRDVYCKSDPTNYRTTDFPPLAEVVQGDMNLLFGKMNNIGSGIVNEQTFNNVVYPSAPGVLLDRISNFNGIRFPSSYTGNLKITGTTQVLIKAGDKLDYHMPLFGVQNDGTTTQTCNIFPIFDIPTCTPEGSGSSPVEDFLSEWVANGFASPSLASFSPAFDPWKIKASHKAIQVSTNTIIPVVTGPAVEQILTVHFELHIRVLPSTQGIPNILYWGNEFTNKRNSTGSYQRLNYLNIEEYNTSFNYKQNGTNDQIQWINVNGDPGVITAA